MNLYKIKVVKNGKTYYDFLLCWQHEGKTYDVRVLPCFPKTGAYSCMYSKAQEVASYQELSELLNKQVA